ncbi:MAG: FGGY family carbohydrate kinase [Anaerolineae bacterium]|nr:FGGY family carbohydrate kinase [Anaerolineae bacterium]
MSAPLAIGIDLGTQQLKVLAVDLERTSVLGSVQAPIHNIKSGPGALEQDPLQWWPLLSRLTRQLIERLQLSPAAVRSIGLSGHMHSIVPLRADGSPAYHCLVWADTRALPQAKAIGSLEGVTLWNPSIAAPSAPKLLWLRDNYPEAYAATRHVLFSKDYLRLRMTGEMATDFSDASGSLLWDFGARQWDADLLARLNIAESLLPQPQESTTLAGFLTEQAAADLGLRAGTPVAVGAGDVACAVIGSGLESPDTLLINAGTAAQVILIQEQPAPYVPERGVRYLFELGIDGKTFAMGALPSAGLSLEWWRSLLGGHLTYGDLDELASDRLGTADGPLFIPYLQGTGTPDIRDDSLGTFLFMSSSTDRALLTAAVMEGVVFGVKRCADALLSGSATPQRQVLITGGVSKSQIMRRIFASAFEATALFRDFSDVSAIGAVTLGAVAAGEADTVAAFLRRLPFATHEVAPDPALAERYAVLSRRHREWAEFVAHIPMASERG